MLDGQRTNNDTRGALFDPVVDMRHRPGAPTNLHRNAGRHDDFLDQLLVAKIADQRIKICNVQPLRAGGREGMGLFDRIDMPGLRLFQAAAVQTDASSLLQFYQWIKDHGEPRQQITFRQLGSL